MRTLIASAVTAAALLAAPQLALAQAGNPANQAPYCLQSPGGAPNCSYQTMNQCEQNSAHFGPDFRCVQNPHSAADRAYEQVEPGATTGAGAPRLPERAPR
jgi:hypothetical protein